MDRTAELLERIQRGDRRSFEELVRAEAGRLHAVAWRVAGDADLAEDAVQELFLRLLEGRAVHRRRGNAGRWLGRIAACLALDQVRRRETRRRL